MILGWSAFAVVVLGILALDLLVIRRRTRAVSVREALAWSAVWILLAVGFGAGVYATRGARPALEYFTAYLVEESLSIDNLFVFLVLFAHFGVPEAHRHKVLFWGILGALAMRLAFIVAGVSLLHAVHAVIYLFGGILVVSGLRMGRPEGADLDPTAHPLLRLVRRLMPVTERFEGDRFFVRRASRWLATPLFVVLVMVEVTDLVFALDSIPAVLGISRDPFIIYTSNVFAVLGLRSLFFALARLLDAFHLLHYGLSVILVFIGVTMLASHWIRVPTTVELLVVVVAITASIVASRVWPKRPEDDAVRPRAMRPED